MSGTRRARRWLRIACALLAAGCARPDAPPDRILLIVVDTLRRDHLPMFGGDTKLPNIEKLAARGLSLEATASFHQTSMSMGALFTGHTPSLETGDAAVILDWLPAASCGMGRFMQGIRGDVCLPEGLGVLGEALRQRGYHTVGVVANLLLFDPAGFSRGFDRWAEVGRSSGQVDRSSGQVGRSSGQVGRSGEQVGRASGQAGQSKKRKPRLAAQMRTWQKVNEAVRAAITDLPDAPLFLYVHYLDVHDWLYRGMSYAESVEELDRGIGDLLAILESQGLLEGTAIVLTSDHGELLDAEHVVESLPLHLGNPAYRDVLDIPLVLVGFDGVRVPSFVRSEDVHHLLLERAGAPRPASRDLAPDELFLTEFTYQTYQKGRFKSLRRRDGELLLLDLESDPGETRDVAARHPEVLAAHQHRVAELTEALAAKSLEPGSVRPSEEWLDRLRALGYLQ